MGLTMFACITI